MALHFFHYFIGAVELRVFDINHRIDEMLMFERTKPIFPAEPGKKRAVVKGGLAIEIKLRCPPRSSAVLQLNPRSVKVIPAMLGAESRKVFDLQIARFFEVMVVGDKVGAFLAPGARGKKQRKQ